MRSIDALIHLTLFALPVFASGKLLPVKRAEGEVLKDSYVVILKDGYNVVNVADSMPDMNITHRWTIVNGFTATLNEGSLDELRANPDVSSISENAAARTSAIQ
jgi:hypothetical protein